MPNDKIIDFNAHDSQVSSTIPYAHKLYSDASKLATNLNQTKSMKLFTESDNYDMYKLFEQNNKKEEKKEDNNFSDTSPFISSDVYKYLLNKDQQIGGGDDDFDEESSTSSSEYEKSLQKSEESDEIQEKINNLKKTSKRSSKKSKKSSVEDNEYMGRTSHEDTYVSSSAHENSDSDSAKISTVSLKHGSRALTESIDTSDIHLVSVEDD